MFKDRWLAKLATQAAPVPTRSEAGLASTARSNTAAAVQPLSTHPRQSPGLDHFFSTVGDQEGLSVLDLAGASQANVSFITSMGHRVYSDDILMALDSAFGGGDFFLNQTDPERVSTFMTQTLDFQEDTFGGALVWDTLQFLAPPLLQEAVDQLHHILRPGAPLLAFFHADEKQTTIPVYSYRISDPRTVLLASKGHRREAQFFNNRNIERMFAKFHAVKFFLTRDNLREVLVTR